MSTPLLLVTVGTDHHRFDRLSGWVESWIERRRPEVSVIHQEGASRPIAGAQALGIVGRDLLLQHLSGASIVVSQAGPGSIVDANGLGVIPIVVPRVARLDEAVDDHQVAFAARMAAVGRVRLADREEVLHGELDRALADPGRNRTSRRGSPAAASARELNAVTREVLARRPGGIRLRRSRRR